MTFTEFARLLALVVDFSTVAVVSWVAGIYLRYHGANSARRVPPLHAPLLATAYLIMLISAMTAQAARINVTPDWKYWAPFQFAQLITLFALLNLRKFKNTWT